MATQLRLVSLIQQALKSHSNNTAPSYSKDEVAFWCPFCKLEHHKTKLTIKIDDASDNFGKWQCWNCNVENNTRGTTVLTLLKRLDSNDKIVGEAGDILSGLGYNQVIKIDNVEEQKQIVSLPTEFKSFQKVIRTPSYKSAFSYLIKRGLDPLDIIRYNIGYCDEGKYKDSIIVPSYDENYNLNYFTVRSYKTKFKINPPINRKDIIPFEWYINWKLPLFITEGVFDAIALRRNAIPLLSKFISSKIYEKIIVNKTPEVIFVLDSDAIKTTYKYLQQFLENDIKVKYMNLQKYGIVDAGSSNFAKLMEIYYKTPEINFEDIIKIKLGTL